MANDLEAGSESPEPASDLRKLVGDTGIEPVTSSVSKLHESVGLRLTERDKNDWILARDLLIEAALTRVAAAVTTT
jgi:hypothetical protein